jgi:hypothetical protein
MVVDAGPLSTQGVQTALSRPNSDESLNHHHRPLPRNVWTIPPNDRFRLVTIRQPERARQGKGNEGSGVEGCLR